MACSPARVDLDVKAAHAGRTAVPAHAQKSCCAGAAATTAAAAARSRLGDHNVAQQQPLRARAVSACFGPVPAPSCLLACMTDGLPQVGTMVPSGCLKMNCLGLVIPASFS